VITAQPRTILISGASRGIGRAIAERLLADGHRLSLGLRDPAALSASSLDPAVAGADRTGQARVQLHTYNAEDPATAEAWVASSVNHFGAIDTVVHCAGVFSRATLLFAPGQEQEIQQLWDVNVMGPWWLTRAAWPHLSAHGAGRIVVLVSMSGKRSKGRLAGYTASKFALMGLCQTMRNEGWEPGIRVTAICPSWVNTDMAAAVNAMPKEAMSQPDDIAALTAQLLELPNSCVPFELAVSCNLEV
jgi:NAD(P)-dependent dehydrogenase (short-subunit alcohol dehydrogenase family)